MIEAGGGGDEGATSHRAHKRTFVKSSLNCSLVSHCASTSLVSAFCVCTTAGAQVVARHSRRHSLARTLGACVSCTRARVLVLGARASALRDIWHAWQVGLWPHRGAQTDGNMRARGAGRPGGCSARACGHACGHATSQAPLRGQSPTAGTSRMPRIAQAWRSCGCAGCRGATPRHRRRACRPPRPSSPFKKQLTLGGLLAVGVLEPAVGVGHRHAVQHVHHALVAANLRARATHAPGGSCEPDRELRRRLRAHPLRPNVRISGKLL